MSILEKHFQQFRRKIIGDEQFFESPYGKKKVVYADWIASGRLYAPIEEKISRTFGPFVGNTHTETSVTGTTMTKSYHYAQMMIKAHVNAGSNDVLISAGFGMTAAIVKFQRILGLKVPEKFKPSIKFDEDSKPVVFVTHMEHHSNHTSWLETIADVVVIEPNSEGLVDLDNLDKTLNQYKNRELKIGSFSACSNVTGIQAPYHAMAKIMHKYNGLCFVDFAASAPYLKIDMHPEDPLEKLDAIFFSPHKFLGGPGTAGILIFDSNLYQNRVPDTPGGGTVDWTNRWGEHRFISNIELREDGGTPGFLQAIRTALCIQLKNQLNPEKIEEREKELLEIIFKELDKIPNLHILANNMRERLGVVSFYVDDIHYNLMVKLLNDRFGVQVRGGCSCAGTYGHFLLHISHYTSKSITNQIDQGDLTKKPGWVRLSIHPTMTNEEAHYITNSIKEIVLNIEEWEKDYSYFNQKNEFIHNNYKEDYATKLKEWFALE